MKRLLRFRPDWTPRVIDLLGFGLITLAVFLAAGLWPALLTAGAICLVVGYTLE